MKDRLAKLIESEETSPARLAEMIGVQPSAISHILSGRNKPGFDFISNLLRGYPNINPKWLLLGEGDMYYLDKVSANHGTLSGIIAEKGENNVEKIEQSSVRLVTNVIEEEGRVIRDTSSTDSITNIHHQGKEPQNEQKELTPAELEPTIERVIVFYSDRSFKEYSND